MNETSTFRRVAATLTIGSFSIAALMGIAALLSGGDFGENQVRVLLTTLIVGCASICVLCYLATAGTRWVMAGAAGAAVAIVPTATALLLVWSDWDGGDMSGVLKVFGVGVVGAVTLAQVCLLLALAGARRPLAPVLWGTVIMATVVALIVCGLITEAIDFEVWQLLGVAAILDVLGTLVTIALAKFGGRDEAPAAGVRVTLAPVYATALAERSRTTGRSTDDLVSEAVAHYLAERADR